MDKVKLLSQSVASQIAAGEVVSRPASVVKELVENSVDAGATSICIVLTDAGRTMIQVTDNGCGMSQADALMSFERHATSKIHETDDLYRLTTFGFRGEAVPSIAAVSEVTLRTRTADSDTGVQITANGDGIQQQEPCVCNVGTTFTVRNLFYNVPARRKFLKSNQTELTHIMTEVERAALSHPEIAFELTLIHYRQFKEKMNSADGVTQQELDEIIGQTWQHKEEPIQVNSITQELPKGFNRATMDKVLLYLKQSATGASADDVASGIGVARVTARRYLDYMEKNNLIRVDIQYGSVGRPINQYFIEE